MKIQLSDHFTFKKLLRFTLPSIAMMIFTSIYGMVDGFFVSNYVGKTPFAAVNLIFPFLMILGAFGAMLGTGGSALIAKTLGEGDREQANRLFSLFIYLSFGVGALIAAAAFIFIRPIAALLGAEGELLENCVIYGRIILVALPSLMLQFGFQSFFVTAEKPGLGFLVTVLAGVTNIVFDALLVAIFRFGIVGAAIATAMSQVVGGIIPLFYFFSKNKSLLRLGKTRFDGKALFRACTNGSSEFLTNISMSLVSMLYNFQLMQYAGENGIAAYGVLMYVGFIFVSIFLGYSIGTAPLIGYNFGAGRRDELQNLLKKSLLLVGITSVAMVIASLGLAYPFSALYVGYDAVLMEMTLHAFLIYSFGFLFSGTPIFLSSFFTALNDGPVSAAISF
ncbi:MAG: MATE family efflux transporter, partial [Clostridia bacterium]|nr:MATE family efflux transporter [Clostridia bacterium]